jgi:hypothetical protein
MAQVVEYLPSEGEALSSDSSTVRKKKRKRRKEGRKLGRKKVRKFRPVPNLQ